ncbi:MAG: type 1 glutamine amidotransferase [Gemmatimonadota bacterium]|nr:MAG: type 1 glutamine amidotransferase [Gemmatimonadota bacterium]
MKILAIQNCEIEGFGFYEQHLVDRGIDYRLIHAYDECSFPPVDECDAFLIGGTPISANEVREHTFLLEEYEYLSGAIAAGKPCFGICCGAQILAQILGAQVRKCEQMEIGGYEVRLTPAGQSNPLLDGFPLQFPVFQWHGDTFDLPADAELLVEGDVCRNQMFRKGNIAGMLFHLEVTTKEAVKWAEEYADELAEVDKSKEQVVSECHQQEQKMKPLANRLMDNFLKDVL